MGALTRVGSRAAGGEPGWAQSALDFASMVPVREPLSSSWPSFLPALLISVLVAPAGCGQSTVVWWGLPGVFVPPGTSSGWEGPAGAGARGRTSHPSACGEMGMVARGCCGGSGRSWKLIWRKKRKMQALKMKKMLRRGVRGCTVWPWPHPPAHSSAPSARLSAAVPGLRFPPARSGDSSRAEAEPPPPYSSHWLRLSPPTGCSSTVPTRHGQLRPDDVSWFHKGSWLHIPPGTLLRGQPPSPELWGERPLPRCCLCPCQGPAGLLTAVQHPALFSSRLPVVSKVLAASGLALS